MLKSSCTLIIVKDNVIHHFCFGSGHPFALAVFENILWVSDQDDHLLYRLDMRPTQNPERLQVRSIQPAAVVVVHPLAKPGVELYMLVYC